MSKYGKWIGGGLGWAFGGPIGGILGFFLGSMYDSMQSGKHAYTKSYQRTTTAGDFGVSLLVLSAAVMKADGKVLKSELDYVKQFFRKQFGEAEAAEKMLLFREIIKQPINTREVSMQIRQFMEHHYRLQLLHYLFGIALADGHVNQYELHEIELIARHLGISASDFLSIKAMFIRDSESVYKILEIPTNATDEEVKKAYRKMAVKYHPDKVTHLGDEFRKAAKEKFQKVNAAYEELKKQRGMN